jgi:lipoate-protein ligase A
MGISGKPEEHLHLPRVQEEKIPVIKRFSGGGTVIVDENTLFITFIMAKSYLDVAPFPEPILHWSAKLYEEAWKIPDFRLRENDYCIGEKKCGGNAQYIKKDRWLHHTSFLWDYSGENMEYLRLPDKRPKYRLDREHSAFLTRMKDHCLDTNSLIDKLKETLVKRLYIENFDLANWKTEPHRQSTHYL